MRVLLDGDLFSTGITLEHAAEITGEDISRFQYHIDDLKQKKCTDIETERDVRIAAGIVYAFPDGQGAIQLRTARDQGNVNAVATRGQSLIAAGDTTTQVSFRDADNVTHYLTGTQAVAMGDAVFDRVDAIYRASWDHKDAVRALANVAEVEAYDYSAGWP